VKRTISILLLAFALALTASAQTARFVGESLVISDGGHRIRLPDIIQQHPIARCVHAVRKRQADYYVLFGASEWSRGYPPRNGNCGAGVESHITWLHVRDGKVLDRKVALYESCFTNRDGWALGWHGSLFTVETEDLVEDSARADKAAVWQTLKWTFDVRRPDAAFTEEQKEHTNP
jgi:hypothetical protein